ncbi:MAG: hypothetical protein K8Q89_08375 [Nitrosarchaeum sp.]|nr:hypothetical protein [Nitrosarchaeum sp.]
MTNDQPTDVKKSRSLQDGKIQESRVFIGSRVEPTSSTGVETPASSRPKKK